MGTATLTATVVGGVLLAGRAVGVHAPACPFRSITRIPCPFCGMTRLADAVAHGRFHLALSADPAGVALLAAMGVLAAVYLVVVQARGRAAPRWMEHRAVPLVLVGLLALHWATTLVSGTLPSA